MAGGFTRSIGAVVATAAGATGTGVAEGRGLPCASEVTAVTGERGDHMSRRFAGGNSAVMTAGAAQCHQCVVDHEWRPTDASGVAGAALL